MTVSAVEEMSSSKSKVYLDGEFAFVLYKGELRKYGIREGQTLSAESYREITEQVLIKRARLRCMNLLQTKTYTTAQLKQKLRQGLYREDIVEDAVAYVTSYGYLDDEKYAEDYIFYNQEKKSRRRIEQDLAAKGIAADTVETAWRRWESQGNHQDEEQQILELLEKRHYDRENADTKERQRMYGFLTRRGFSPEQIFRVL